TEVKKIIPKIIEIIEPMPKNTAACIGLSAISLLDKDKDAVMFLETADHIYNNIELYLEHIKKSLEIASNNEKIVLIGINPQFPHTGLGYVEKGDMFGEEDKINSYIVKSFKEKPDLETAKSYVDSGKFLWNSGMFVAKCSVMLDEIKKNLPGHYEGLMKIKESGFDKEVIKNEFEKFEKISIDYGVMEKSDKTVVIDANMHWDDVGDLKAFERYLKKDENGNSVIAFGNNPVKFAWNDSKNNIVIDRRSGVCKDEKEITDSKTNQKNKMIALNGINDSIIVCTDDVILVSDKEKAQDVKKIVGKISEEFK
ncbi:MAG: mannose-1-phosphate guanylyltransferase, partial [Nanoarchaeota archaeon]